MTNNAQKVTFISKLFSKTLQEKQTKLHPLVHFTIRVRFGFMFFLLAPFIRRSSRWTEHSEFSKKKTILQLNSFLPTNSNNYRKKEQTWVAF